MALEPRYFFLKPPGLNVSEKRKLIGRFVRTPSDPICSYSPTDLPGLEPDSFINLYLTNVESIIKSASSDTAKATVSPIATFATQKSRGSEIKFQCESLEISRLRQHEDVFRSLIKSSEVQEYLARILRFGKVAYFVCSVVVWKGAKFEIRSTSDKSKSLETKLPIGSALPGIPGALGAVGTGIGGDGATEALLKGTVEGEHIIALEYRRVKRNMMGFGSNVRLEEKLRFEGGRYFGSDSEDEHESGDDAEDPEEWILTEEIEEGFVGNME